MMRTALLAGAASLLLISAANAADIVAPEAFDWTGPYIGLQGGYGWGSNDATFDLSEAVTAPAALDSSPVTPNIGKGSIDIDGFIGGAHAGYNYQMDSFVVGAEGDIEYTDMSGDTDIVQGGETIGKMKQQLDWLGSLRLRAGFAADRALFYATGGLAVGEVELSLRDADGKFADNTDTNWGWTIGAGIEYAFTDDLSARIEYRYTDLGSIDAGDASLDGKGEVDTAFHAVRAGLSWHF